VSPFYNIVDGKTENLRGQPLDSLALRFSLPAQRSLHFLTQHYDWEASSAYLILQLVQKLQPINIWAGSPAKWHLALPTAQFQPIFPILFLQNRIGVWNL